VPSPGPALEDFTRAVVAAVVGVPVAGIEALALDGDRAVLRVTSARSARSARRLVVKVAGRTAGAPEFERTAAVTARAGAAGVPVPTVLAADDSGRLGPWRYLVLEHLDGTEWRLLRPRLDPDRVAAAHRQLAAAVVALRSVHLDAFGELDAHGRTTGGGDVVTALHHRVELRVRDPRSRAEAHRLLAREAPLFAGVTGPALCHDDLHHGNVLFRPAGDGWQLAALLDWDKAWAGPGESDVARMAFWDDMTGPAFWAAYRRAVPVADGEAERRPIHQLLWCLEYADGSARHAADTAALRRRLGLG
jgi:aminoglycoside phosphotransferase (APT) family kinase protein